MNKKPLVFDPVAVGATSYRRITSKGEFQSGTAEGPSYSIPAAELLSHWQPTVIKGNAAEIGALAESTEVASRGVDSTGSGFSDPAAVVKALSRKRGERPC